MRGRGAQNREHQTKRAEDEEGKRGKFVENKKLRTESTRKKRAEDEAVKKKNFVGNK